MSNSSDATVGIGFLSFVLILLCEAEMRKFMRVNDTKFVIEHSYVMKQRYDQSSMYPILSPNSLFATPENVCLAATLCAVV